MAALPDDEKIELFGRALYGDAWIGSLTERERWLLDNYERWVDPSMIAVGEAINGGTNLYAGGITWTDIEYDERILMVRGRWLALPNDPALAREVEEAVSRRDRIDDQRSEVSRQLQNGAGFPPAVRQGGEAQQSRPQYSSKLIEPQAKAPASATVERSDRGAPPQYDYDQIKGEAFRLFAAHRVPCRDGERGWQTRADLERKLAGFCHRVFGNEPAKSTLQNFRPPDLRRG